jgi:cyclic beta-1,2-glucan synthetase
MESGIDAYPFYSTFYYTFFDKEIYCGKGIYKLSNFYKKLEGTFPEKKILSHDIIEGSVLNTGTANIIFEDAPTGFLSDRERRIRWQRGDIQLLPFMNGKWRDEENHSIERKIQPLYKYIMAKNILYNVKELMLFCILLIGFFTNNFPTIIALVSLFYAPYLLNKLKIYREVIYNVRIKYIMKKASRNTQLYIEALVMLGYYAISNTYVLISTIYRMIKKTKLLEWKPYYNSQNATKFESYVKEFAIPTLVLTIINFVMFILNYDFSILFSAYIILSLFIYYRLYYLSNKDYKKPDLGDDDKNYLMEIANKTYKYFEYMRNDKGIIADNLQIKPYKGEAKITSPTNIGFSLLAEICAYKLGIISYDKCNYNLIKSLESIEKLDKWEGNLYNWYELENCTPVNKFVSSVDSGNFLSALLIIKEFFHENHNLVGELRTQILIKMTNLEALFDLSKNLFYLGYDGQKLDGHYDLLSSEARLLSMVYISLYGKSEHFHSLHRDYTSYKGNTMLSWSGTMFEYLMPDLFLPLPAYSTLKNTAINVVEAQIKFKWKGVWGISESAYSLFDEKQSYQYHAFGLNMLSLRNESNTGVISPYSSALALAYKTEEVIDNFKKLEKYNLLEEYGFLESIDFGNNESIISSYMSHHQGMIICAITNKLADNYLVNLLQNNAKFRGSVQLFNENIFRVRNGVIYNNTPKISTANKNNYYKYCDNLEQYYNCAGLTDGNIIQFFASNGNSFLSQNNTIIDKYVPIFEEATGGYFYVKNENNVYNSPTILPYNGEKKDYNFSYTGTQVFYNNISENLNLSATLMSGIEGVVRKLTYPLYTKQVAFYMPITLNSFDGYYSHPTFNDLFIETFIENKILYIKKRSLLKDGKDKFIAVLVNGLKNIVWETNRYNFIGRNGNLKMPYMLSDDYKNKSNPSIGDVLSPCIAFTAEPMGNECQICLILGESIHEIKEKIKVLPNDFYSFALACASQYPMLQETQEILGELLYANYSNKILQKIDNEEDFNTFKAFTQNKKVISYVYSEDKAEKFLIFIKIIKNLQLLNLPIKIVVYVKNRGNNNLNQYINDLLTKHIISNFIILDNPDLLEYSFIAFNEELQYTKKQFMPSKIEEIYQNLDESISIEEEMPSGGLISGSGRAFKDSYYQKSKKPTLLPYSNIISAKYGGLIATNNGGGFYFFENSRENKMTRFDNDFVTDMPSELICFKNNIGYAILNGGYGLNRITEIKKGLITHKFNYGGMHSQCSSYVICDGKAKVSEISIDNTNGGFISLIYTMYPSLDWVFSPALLSYKYEKDVLIVTNLKKNNKLYIKIISASEKAVIKMETLFSFPSIEYFSEEINDKIFIIASQDYDLLNSLNVLNLMVLKENSIKQFENINNLEINSPIKSLNLLTNFLPYQILSSRINARAGFYQVGGGIGFRDQLQDSLAFSNQQDIIKNQIIESCLHQYAEGDVMHWWHPPQFGLRTRISDDRLFLPYVVCEYAELSKNMEFLEYSLPYLNSTPLNPNENNRLENPSYTSYKESVYQHCIRAIKSALKYGEHGLLIMGTGDWNDGMDFACCQGKGESVFNSMFAYYVLKKFSNYCTLATQKELLKIAEELKEKVNKYCFDNDRYMRLFTDDGRWLGSSRSATLQLDLLVQSFAVISGIADKERGNLVLNTAKQLIDKKAGIIDLLYPPLDKEEYLGYISAYPKGIRENGGQYTHSAMWFLHALTKLDRQDEALELFQMINPVEKCSDKSKNAMYKAEPYVLSGDVYSNEQNYGRSGWSWYTGSASWAYRLVVEQFYGLKRRGQKLYIYPHLPKKLSGSIISYKYMDSLYNISFIIDDISEVKQDGKLLEDNCIILENNKNSEILVTCKNI